MSSNIHTSSWWWWWCPPSTKPTNPVLQIWSVSQFLSPYTDMYTYIPGVLVNAWLVDVLSVCDIISSISKCKVTMSWCVASWVGGEVLPYVLWMISYKRVMTNIVYGKTFKEENFCGLSLRHKSFPVIYDLVNWQYKSTSMLLWRFSLK